MCYTHPFITFHGTLMNHFSNLTYSIIYDRFIQASTRERSKTEKAFVQIYQELRLLHEKYL